MTKKLVFIALAAFFAFSVNPLEAKVCRIGDADCESGNLVGSAGGSCDQNVYKHCDNPRVGATYCYGVNSEGKSEALYRQEDCCSGTWGGGDVYQYQYCGDTKDDENNTYSRHLEGWGKSCRGAADNITYYEGCRCEFGYTRLDDGVEGTDDSIDHELKDAEWGSVDAKFTDRCVRGDGDEAPSDEDNQKCLLVGCNKDRHFFSASHQNLGKIEDYCLLRNKSVCSGASCVQIWGCDPEKGYFRNDSDYLERGKPNFITVSSSDIASNECTSDVTIDGVTVCNDYNDVMADYYSSGASIDYFVNRYACYYGQGNAATANDNERGLSCGELVNYCYKYENCNEARRWFGNAQNAILMYTDYDVYKKWEDIVERNTTGDVADSYSKLGAVSDNIRDEAYAGYISSFFTEIGVDLEDVKSADETLGCLYIGHDCHGKFGNQCYKKITCANGFKNSFINISSNSYYVGESNDQSAIITFENLYNSAYDYNLFGNGCGATCDAKEVDKISQPACVYEVSRCNDSTGCFKFKRCEDGYVKDGDISIMENGKLEEGVETIWEKWFNYVHPECNDGTVCYKAIGCEAPDGSYDNSPNTSFFVTISSQSNLGLTCYRGEQCNFEAGAYKDSPNTSYFITISSDATSSTCYRGESCNLEAGAYEESPNTMYFVISSSEASSSICYRGESCNTDEGAYVAEPNTSFFLTSSSQASSLECFRSEGCNVDGGAYDITDPNYQPNTSYFITVSSTSTGSTCYRGESCNFEAGAYDSEPNTSFFLTSSSYASGSTCYRGESCNFEAGAYDSEPNTSFFLTSSSYASGSTCFRGESCHEDVGGYDENKKPNTSFFVTISSEASSSTCYRGEGCNTEAGAYDYLSHPNTSYFLTARSTINVALSTKSTCYRGTACHERVGGYDENKKPNTSFFLTSSSHASGSTCFRGEGCNTDAGAYDYLSHPNTSYFLTSSSTINIALNTKSTCYRGTACHERVGGYDENKKPNTSFFLTSSSHASSLECFRGEGCNTAAGAYKESPDIKFFETEKSTIVSHIWSTCYRASACAKSQYKAYEDGVINTIFFETSHDTANIYGVDSNCYRGDKCATTAADTWDAKYFKVDHSVADKKYCYRSSACADLAYSDSPNTKFFETTSDKMPGKVAECWFAEKCNEKEGASSNPQDTTFFVTVSSQGSGKICYRADECQENVHDESIIDKVNTSFFFATSLSAVTSPSTTLVCSKVNGCHLNAGAYTDSPSTSLFETASSTLTKPSGTNTTCYRATSCNFNDGAYEGTPNTLYFLVKHSVMSSSECWRATACNEAEGSYDYWSTSKTPEPNTSFFLTTVSRASSETCYRATACNAGAGAYDSAPNTMYFNVHQSTRTSISCFRGTSCADGAYNNKINPALAHSSWFKTSMSEVSGSECWRATACNHDEFGGAYPNSNTSFFVHDKSSASTVTCYRTSSCQPWAHATNPNADEKDTDKDGNTQEMIPFFTTVSSVNSSVDNKRCYRAIDCDNANGSYTSGQLADLSNEQYFNIASSTVSYLSSANAKDDITCYRATGCNNDVPDDMPTYSSTIAVNTSFFLPGTIKMSGITCNIGTGCNPNNATEEEEHPSYFVYDHSSYSTTCYRATGCATTKGAYEKAPNTLYFNYSVASAQVNFKSSRCYRATACSSTAHDNKKDPAKNHVYFRTSMSSATGLECWRTEGCNTYYATSSLNTSFFIPDTTFTDNGITCETSISCNENAGAYSSISSNYFVTESETAPYTDFDVPGNTITCSRATACVSDATKNESQVYPEYFYTTSDSIHTSPTNVLTCYRASGCKYSVEDTKYFKVIGEEFTPYTKNPNTADGYIKCPTLIDCASNETIPAYFTKTPKKNTTTGLTCTRATGCVGNDTTPSTSVFKISRSSLHEANNCPYATGCKIENGYSTEAIPSTGIRYTVASPRTNITQNGAYRPCHTATGCGINYTDRDSVSTSVFTWEDTTAVPASYKSSKVLKCVQENGCNTSNFFTSTSPSTTYFNVSVTKPQYGTGFACYRANGCATRWTKVLASDNDFYDYYKVDKSPTTSYTSNGQPLQCMTASGCEYSYDEIPPFVSFWEYDSSFFKDANDYNVIKLSDGTICAAKDKNGNIKYLDGYNASNCQNTKQFRCPRPVRCQSNDVNGNIALTSGEWAINTSTFTTATWSAHTGHEAIYKSSSTGEYVHGTETLTCPYATGCNTSVGWYESSINQHKYFKTSETKTTYSAAPLGTSWKTYFAEQNTTAPYNQDEIAQIYRNGRYTAKSITCNKYECATTGTLGQTGYFSAKPSTWWLSSTTYPWAPYADAHLYFTSKTYDVKGNEIGTGYGSSQTCTSFIGCRVYKAEWMPRIIQGGAWSGSTPYYDKAALDANIATWGNSFTGANFINSDGKLQCYMPTRCSAQYSDGSWNTGNKYYVDGKWNGNAIGKTYPTSKNAFDVSTWAFEGLHNGKNNAPTIPGGKPFGYITCKDRDCSKGDNISRVAGPIQCPYATGCAKNWTEEVVDSKFFVIDTATTYATETSLTHEGQETPLTCRLATGCASYFLQTSTVETPSGSSAFVWESKETPYTNIHNENVGSNSIECSKATACNNGYYNTSANTINTSYFNVVSNITTPYTGESNPMTCSKIDCKHCRGGLPNYSDDVLKHFKENENHTLLNTEGAIEEIEDLKLKCPKGRIEDVDTCYAPSQLLDDGVNQYFEWSEDDTIALCTEDYHHNAGCREEILSHNKSYVDTLKTQSLNGTMSGDYEVGADGPTGNDAGTIDVINHSKSNIDGLDETTYDQVFKQAKLIGCEDSEDKECYVACSCAGGDWLSIDDIDTSVEGWENNYYKVTSNVQLSYDYVLSTGVDENDLIIEGSSSASSLSTGANVGTKSTNIGSTARTLSSGISTTQEPSPFQTCYKQKGNNYFINIDYCNENDKYDQNIQIRKIETDLPEDKEVVIAMRNPPYNGSSDDDIVYRDGTYFVKSHENSYTYYEDGRAYNFICTTHADGGAQRLHESAIFIEDKATQCNLNNYNEDRKIDAKYCIDNYSSYNYFGTVYTTGYSNYDWECDGYSDGYNIINSQAVCAWDSDTALAKSSGYNVGASMGGINCFPHDENTQVTGKYVVTKGNDTYNITYNHVGTCSSGGGGTTPDPEPDDKYYNVNVTYLFDEKSDFNIAGGSSYVKFSPSISNLTGENNIKVSYENSTAQPYTRNQAGQICGVADSSGNLGYNNVVKVSPTAKNITVYVKVSIVNYDSEGRAPTNLYCSDINKDNYIVAPN